MGKGSAGFPRLFTHFVALGWGTPHVSRVWGEPNRPTRATLGHFGSAGPWIDDFLRAWCTGHQRFRFGSREKGDIDMAVTAIGAVMAVGLRNAGLYEFWPDPQLPEDGPDSGANPAPSSLSK